jgi:hypothetical protein
MTDVEACQQLLARLQRFGSVPARELRQALGEEHWTVYQEFRDWVKGLHEEAKIASYELREYVRMLRIADLWDPQPHRNSGRRRKRASPRTAASVVAYGKRFALERSEKDQDD